MWNDFVVGVTYLKWPFTPHIFSFTKHFLISVNEGSQWLIARVSICCLLEDAGEVCKAFTVMMSLLVLPHFVILCTQSMIPFPGYGLWRRPLLIENLTLGYRAPDSKFVIVGIVGFSFIFKHVHPKVESPLMNWALFLTPFLSFCHCISKSTLSIMSRPLDL